MTTPQIIWLDEAGSTNSVMREMTADGSCHAGLVIAAHRQTAGRGQRGNSCESEPEKNLTFSMLLCPQALHARDQFTLSECVALGVAEAIESLMPENAPEIAVKWPNDIYAGDRKICGILIENSLSGCMIGKSIAGIGINVNQEVFRSDAPNPISIIHLTGNSTSTKRLLEDVCTRILVRCAALDAGENARIHSDYLARLWRRQGEHTYREPGGKIFLASIASIAPTGHITLRNTDGMHVTYAFKEVEAVL